MVSSDGLSDLGAISNNRYLVVKCNNANLTLSRAVSHVVYLRVDGSFDALDSWYIGHSFILCIKELVWVISKLSHLSGKCRESVSLELMLTGYGLADAHWARDIAAEHNGNVFWGVASHECILYLGCSLEQVCHFSGLWNLLLTYHYIVFVVAELTIPYLISINLGKFTRLVEDGLTVCADLSVTSGHLALVSEAL